MRKTVLLLALLAAAAAAKPPLVPDYARVEELERRLNEVYAELKAKEDFAKKPVQERLILKFRQGVPTYEHVKKLTGEALVKELFTNWKEAEQDPPSEDVVRILGLLPDVLKERFSTVPIPKKERYNASKPLVNELTSDYLHIRKAAIDSLEAIYGTNRLYQPEMSATKRRSLKKEWEKFISRKKR